MISESCENRPPAPIESWRAAGVVLLSVVASLGWLVLAPTMDVPRRLIVEVVALGCWVQVMRVATRCGLPPWCAWVGGAMLFGVAVSKSPTGSRDLWSYVMQGRMIVVHHASPYTHRPSEYASIDRFVSFVPAGWRASRSPYGPLFVFITGVGSAVAGNSVLANRVVHQALAAAALGATALLYSRRGKHLAVPFLLLNPLCLAIVNGGHNDLMVGAFLVFAIDMAIHTTRRRKNPVFCGVLLACAALIKITGVFPGLAVIAWLFQRFGRRAGLIAGTSAAFTGALAYAVVGGATAIRPLLSSGSRISRASVAGVFHLSAGSAKASLAITAVLVVALFVVLGGVRKFGESESPTPVAITVVVAFLASAPFVLPWYPGWVLPMAAESTGSRSSRAAVILSAALFLAYTEAPGSSTTGLSRSLVWLPLIVSLSLGSWFCIVAFRRSSVGMRQ